MLSGDPLYYIIIEILKIKKHVSFSLQVCGIKLEIAKPRAGNPKQGFIVPNLTLAPICHPQFRPGPPSEEAQVRSLCFKFTLNPLKFSPLRETDTKKGE